MQHFCIILLCHFVINLLCNYGLLWATCHTGQSVKTDLRRRCVRQRPAEELSTRVLCTRRTFSAPKSLVTGVRGGGWGARIAFSMSLWLVDHASAFWKKPPSDFHMGFDLANARESTCAEATEWNWALLSVTIWVACCHCISEGDYLDRIRKRL